jgi:hypothetical protein
MGRKRTRAQLVLLYAVGLLEELRRDGLVAQGGPALNPSGRAEFERLVAQGFDPSPAELADAARVLSRHGAGPAVGLN